MFQKERVGGEETERIRRTKEEGRRRKKETGARKRTIRTGTFGKVGLPQYKLFINSLTSPSLSERD